MQRLHDHNLQLRAKDLEWQRRIVGAAAAAKAAVAAGTSATPQPPPPPADPSLSFSLPQQQTVAPTNPMKFARGNIYYNNTNNSKSLPNSALPTANNNFVNNTPGVAYPAPFPSTAKPPVPTTNSAKNQPQLVPKHSPNLHRHHADDIGEYDGDVDNDQHMEDEEREEDEHQDDGLHYESAPNESVLDDNFRESSPMSADSEPSTSTTREMSPSAPAVESGGPSGSVDDTQPPARASKSKAARKRSMTTSTTSGPATAKARLHNNKVGKIRRHRMTKEEEARFNPADLVDLSGSTAAKSRKMTDTERDIMLHKRRLRNRASAARSRDKQRKTIHDLSDEMDELMAHSKALLSRCIAAESKTAQLQTAYDALAKENADLKNNSLLLSPSGSTSNMPTLASQIIPSAADQKKRLSFGSNDVPLDLVGTLTPANAPGNPIPVTNGGHPPTQAPSSSPPQLRRTGSLVVSMSSDMLHQIRNLTGDGSSSGTAMAPGMNLNNNMNNNNNMSTTTNSIVQNVGNNNQMNSNNGGGNPLMRIPSKLHVSLSTDNLQQDGGISSFPRNFSVVERLLELTGPNASFDINCDLHVRD